MQRTTYPSFRETLADSGLVKVAGVHSALGGLLAQEAGFPALWASSFEISAVRGLPDASLLTMTEYLQAAADVQKVAGIPVIADCDTGYGNNMNVAHMVHEYERAGISAICIEDKVYPKMNSFAGTNQELIEAEVFAGKIEVARRARSDLRSYLIARTEALICGRGVDEAIARCHRYADAGADAVLIHSRQPSNAEILEFLDRWQRRLPVVVVPTTYPDWHADDAAKAGVNVVIYANQGLRAMISALRRTYGSIHDLGAADHLTADIASVGDVFRLQRLEEWQHLQP
ncbi:isocitrate lyase/phosphoenolpyruvate mutase family protein [Micromonospora sp. KC207]|uniref:isocitrate lyase/phosphoenolpyruvate mutase family protein n=1 Tax=Micromonospora sp. KC207 TaxID=2530377 RepID=UPI001404A093|nr:isocitrate lyase/phosphoenolpyruvate mutase family protein [Micromonospora sp. KC207]